MITNRELEALRRIVKCNDELHMPIDAVERADKAKAWVDALTYAKEIISEADAVHA